MNERSFANVRNWLNEVEEHCDRVDCARIIVANKCDLCEYFFATSNSSPFSLLSGSQLSAQPRVPREDISLLCQTLDINAVDVSAKSGKRS